MSAGRVERPRVLVVLPSWLGDTIMATPTLRLLLAGLPGSVIVGLARPGMDELLAGSELLDDVVTADARSVTGPARIAQRLKVFRFDAALILPNSFASAMGVRLAGVPVRVGYDRDGRGMLLTHALEAPLRALPHTGFAPISAVDYYLEAGRALLRVLGREPPAIAPALELSASVVQDARAEEVLYKAGVPDGAPFALLNPGGNNPAKRWPVERFAAVAHHLISRHGLRVAINGSPAEAELVALIRDTIVLNEPADGPQVACLHECGGTIGSLKGVVRRARIVITNDTGPRHIAAAFGVRCVTLFGPTDPRWTTLPEPAGPGRERILVADPSLPESELADDHPDRCRIDRIHTTAVVAAADTLLTG
ncbi:MAG: glycosyltransferase family 9 protein [Phycisphaerales bacterium]